MSSEINGDLIYDYLIIGSGFGGAVSAMRLTEKGYKVLVLEKGKRFGEQAETRHALAEVVVQFLPDAAPLAFRGFQNLALQPRPLRLTLGEPPGHVRKSGGQFLHLIGPRS